jgi:hypothetical protein
MTSLSTKDERFAALAGSLARAVASSDVAATDAMRVIKHKLRRRNTNRALLAPYRSRAAQDVVDRYAALDQPVPKNDSLDALHSDHLHPLTEAELSDLTTQEAWLARLHDFDAVVCVTAAENYSLQQVERAGATGWDKYHAVGIEVFEVSA